MIIDSETYKLPKDNYYHSEYTKTQIVVSDTTRKDMYHYDSWVNRGNGQCKKTAAYTIRKDGTIYEHYNPKYYSDFITLHDISPFVIPIVLENVGWLVKDEPNGRYYDWLGHSYMLDDVTNQKWRNKQTWDKYTNEQIISLKNLTDKLCDEHNIKKQCIGNTVFNEDVDIYEGITFRSNYYQEVTDINPAFDMITFNDL